MSLDSDQPWSEMDILDLRNSLTHGRSVEEAADFLCRDIDEVSAKMAELGLEERPKIQSKTSRRA
jgi:hypothetical protein